MPHYPTTGKRDGDRFYIFSTIVMEPITDEMTRDEMATWLLDNGYDTWVDKRPMKENPDIAQHYDTDGLRELLETMQSMMYWNGLFWYVTEEDGYFVG